MFNFETLKPVGNKIIIFALAIILSSWIIIIAAIRNDYNVEMDRAKQNTKNLSSALEKYISATFAQIESSLFSLRKNWDSGIGKNEMHTLLHLFTASRSELFNLISVIDADGNVSTTNQKEFKPTYSGDRPFFIFHKENKSSDMLIGSPLLGRLTGKWYFPISVRLQDSKGNFSGVLLASINPFYFSKIFNEVNIGTQSLIFLSDEKGIVYSGMRGNKELGLDVKIPDSEIINIFNTKKSLSETKKSFIDGVERIGCKTFISNQNMFVSVEIGVGEWFAKLRLRAYLLILIELFFSFFILWIAVNLRKVISAKEALNNELDCFFSSALDLLCIADSKGYFLRLNKEWENTLGYGTDEIMRSSFLDFVHPEDKQTTVDALNKLSSQNAVLNFTNRYKTKSGDYRYIEWRSIPRGEKIYTAARDITERIKVEQELRANEEKLNALFSSMTEMLIIYELVFDSNNIPVNYKIIDCNRAFTEITGLKKENIIGKLATEAFGKSKPFHLKEFSETALTKKTYQYSEYSEGLDRHFIISVVSLGKNQFATVSTDVTSFKQSQQIINAKNKELENYLYVASHDLRSPLVNIQGFGKRLNKNIEVLKKLAAAGDFDEKKRIEIIELIEETAPKTLEYIQTNAAKMDNLINGLLQISRTGRETMIITKIDMNKLIKTILNSKEYQLSEAGAFVNIQSLDYCWGDENLLNQLFSNIIANAINYRDKNRKLIIDITSQIQYNKVVYSVKDNGIGVAERHKEKIWDIFFRVNSAAKESGEGLGLSIVKRIADKHKGKVSIESEEGVGSVFHIELLRYSFTIEENDIFKSS